jgi:hypothetical protein
MDWREELEALRNEAAALVEAAPPPAPVEARAPAPRPPSDLALSTLNRPSRLLSQADSLGLSEREQIVRRVASFKAHQEHVRREREDFYSRTMQRTRDVARGHISDEQT